MEPLNERSYRVVPGTTYGTPKEIWGFRARAGRGAPADIARRFLRVHTDLLGLAGIRSHLTLQRVVPSLGATHLIFQQRHRQLPIYRAYVTVHVSHDRHIYLVKNRAVPKDFQKERGRFRLSKSAAARRARRTLKGPEGTARVVAVDRRWFPADEILHPAYRVRVHRERPREEWIIYVNAHSGGILSQYDNLATARGRAAVFDPNPVVALNDWRSLRSPTGRPRRPPQAAYASVSLTDLKGNGRLEGRRVTTCLTPRPVKRADEQFVFSSAEPGFLETMTYFHVDRAIRYLESLGYRGARAIFSTPLPINAAGTRQDNSWYSPGLRQLTFGTGGVDDAEDAEIVLHEFGHALQDAICPDFGQSAQAAAMGEGFGDYFAASFFAAVKPSRLRPLLMSWDSIADSTDEPPYLRRVDTALTFESFDHSDDADEHENGQIWSATLWDIWNALGREVADRLVIDSHFQLDGFTTFARGARAIIDADRNLFRGRHVVRLRDIFTRRGIGPVG